MLNFNIGKTFIGLLIASVLLTSFILSRVSYGSDHKEGLNEEKKNATGQVGFKIELNKKAYKIGEPIRVKCKLTNESLETLYLFPLLFRDFEFDVKYLDGGEVPFGSAILVSEEYTVKDINKLLPNEFCQYEELFNDSGYIMPKRAGKYEIYGTYTNRTKSLDGIKVWTGKVKSNTETFNIYK